MATNLMILLLPSHDAFLYEKCTSLEAKANNFTALNHHNNDYGVRHGDLEILITLFNNEGCQQS